MSNKHVIDVLSAYIDGEARHPERIERHLQQCPECARRHMALLKISSHLGALGGPEADPAFVTRVMARVREDAMLPARRFAFPVAPQWVAALLLLVGGLGLAYEFLSDEPSTAVVGPEQVAVVPDVTYLDEDAVVEAMAKLMDAGADLSYVAPDLPRSWLLEDSTLSYDEMITLYADTLDGSESQVLPSTGTNVYGLIEGMESSETETLEALLADYMGKG